MGKNLFKNRIKKLRMDKGLSMEELAVKLDTKKSTVGMWENSDSIPREEMLIKISKFFNVSIDYLLGNEKMEGIKPENKKLYCLQRGLENMDEERLEKAEKILKTVFTDLFNEGDDDDDGRF